MIAGGFVLAVVVFLIGALLFGPKDEPVEAVLEETTGSYSRMFIGG